MIAILAALSLAPRLLMFAARFVAWAIVALLVAVVVVATTVQSDRVVVPAPAAANSRAYEGVRCSARWQPTCCVREGDRVRDFCGEARRPVRPAMRVEGDRLVSVDGMVTVDVGGCIYDYFERRYLDSRCGR